MVLSSINEDTIESSLSLWRERVFSNKRKELSAKEVTALFQQKELNNAFFKIMDHDSNGALSQEEWTGCFSKLLGDNEPIVINWFVDKFLNYCEINDKEYINQDDFMLIVTDVEFGYRFCQLIGPKSRRVNAIHLITSLEIIGSLSKDAKWLSWLKYQFTEAMSKNGLSKNEECRVTYQDFAKNFNFKEKFLAQRLFDYLDSDNSGYLTLREFINGIEVVVNGNEQEKMEFLFRVFDVDGDGRIDYPELRMLLKCCLEDSPSLDVEEAVDDLTTALFRDMDSDCSGDITIEELKEAFKKHDELYKALSVSTSIWIKPKYTHAKKKNTWWKRIVEKLSNNRGLLYFMIVYILINIATSVTAYCNYSNENVYVICARICGNGLNFNCALVLVLVLRKHFTWLRSKGAGAFLPLDYYIDLHKMVAMVILVETIIHTVAHLINLYIVCTANDLSYWLFLFTDIKSWGFPTGVIVFVLLAVILLFTLSCVRKRGYFQIFYLFHLLSIPFLLIMLFHGKQFWKWIIVPAVHYIIEKVLRFKKTRSQHFGDTYISEALLLPSKVTHLVIRRPEKFKYSAGDYLFLNIPVIAKYEWHPFSISSVPECQDYLWLHIRAAGNWTNKLNSFVREHLSSKYADESMLRTSMRSRMSRILSDVTTLNQIHTNKRVSWSHSNFQLQANQNSINDNLFYLNNFNNYDSNLKLNYLKNSNNALFPTPKTATESQAHRKSILKAMSKDSIQNGSDKGINDIAEEAPSEITSASTPNFKIGSFHNTSESENNDNNNNENSNAEIKVDFKDLESMNTEQLGKLVSGMKEEQMKIDATESILKKNSNVDFKKLENQDIKKNNVVAIDMDMLENKKPFILNEDNNETKNSKDKLKKFLLKNNNGTINDEDTLGYLKMYKKANRLCIQQVPTHEQWRLQVYIDGPYGTTSRDIFDCEHILLIAAGIGITPYASILQSIMQRFKKTKNACPSCEHKWEIESNDRIKSKIKKVDFIWVTREQRSLEWFISMLSQMEIDQKKNDENFLETHLYVTSAKRQTDLKSIGLHMTLDVIYSEEDAKLIEGLKQRTHYGRPNWDLVMQQMIRKQEGKISVFFCGPPSLSNVLETKCKQYNLTFRKEIF